MARSNTSEVFRAHCTAIAQEEAVLREGGGKAGHERQRKMGRLSVRGHRQRRGRSVHDRSQ